MTKSNKAIKIAPSKEGSFRAATGTKKGKTVNKGDESKILKAKEGATVALSNGKKVVASGDLKKKANFAKNFGK